MRKLFGRKDKDQKGQTGRGAGSVAPTAQSNLSNSKSNSRNVQSDPSQNQILPIKVEYLDLNKFRLPAGAESMFAQSKDEEIVLDACRKCSEYAVHTFMEWTTRIIIGIPETDDYRAISYLWGDTIQLPMRCSRCQNRFTIPMESAYKFRRLMMTTANSGDAVWLDAVSIDQTSNEDKQRVIAVMGDIYSRAKTVSVLFPTIDGRAFKTVWDLTAAATAINLNEAEFSQPGQDGHPRPRHQELSKVCKEFWQLLVQLDKELDQYQYWKRAWTFQEWALARQLSITWEAGMPQNMEPVKTVIMRAATITAIYKFSYGVYANIDVGFNQTAQVAGRYEVVRRLFPDEVAFQSPGEISEEEVNLDMMMPSMRFNHALGLRFGENPDPMHRRVPIHQQFALRADLPESVSERFRHRLGMALATFGVSEREAKFKADLVHSWASMCNIKYTYNVNDPYLVALQKVLHSLRTVHETKVYNFLVNTTGAGGEVDAKFLKYASSHDQCNAGLVKGKFSDIPIFTGRADTGTHLRLALDRPSTLPVLRGEGVGLRKVKEASIFQVVSMSDHDTVLWNMQRLVSGTADGIVFTDVVQSISEILRATPTDQLSRSSLVVVRIPLDTPDANEMAKLMGMLTWTIIPGDVDPQSCFVAREELNGTLVLATPGRDGMRVVSYLTVSDHQSGTVLIQVNAHKLDCQCRSDHSVGDILVTLTSPIRRGANNPAVMGDRLIQGRIGFEPGTYLAY